MPFSPLSPLGPGSPLGPMILVEPVGGVAVLLQLN
nr:MAG TPA: hypothetical protein [Caudoviricetes sp.]